MNTQIHLCIDKWGNGTNFYEERRENYAKTKREEMKTTAYISSVYIMEFQFETNVNFVYKISEKQRKKHKMINVLLLAHMALSNQQQNVIMLK